LIKKSSIISTAYLAPSVLFFTHHRGFILNLQHASIEELRQWEAELTNEHSHYCQQAISLDLTRGKPSSGQLSLSDALDGSLEHNYLSADGTDTRNYGGLDGIKEARQLGADVLGVHVDEVSAQGNSSLSLMFYAMFIARDFGLGSKAPWKDSTTPVKFICPVPGYDRHYSVCEKLGIEMITVPMTATGPDMDAVEALLKTDSSIKGMWCVPKYSNPTGTTYSDETVERIAQLSTIASDNFYVFWDNAYALHDFNEVKILANIMDYCRTHGTVDSIIQFASTSKISHAGSGIAFIASSKANLDAFREVLAVMSIGPDKVNQLRHLRLFPDYSALLKHMQKHATLLKPRFNCVLKHLHNAFGDNDLGEWDSVEGGYFISFNAHSGLAKIIVKLAADAGVKLTPAGATFPYGKDPEDNNIRIAPSVPSLEEVDQAMSIFTNCVKLASIRKVLNAQ
jgi:aspartate/methionine/tyrosine aminotransferase